MKEAYIVVARDLFYHVYSMMKNEKPYRVRLPNGEGGDGTLPLDHKKSSNKFSQNHPYREE